LRGSIFGHETGSSYYRLSWFSSEIEYNCRTIPQAVNRWIPTTTARVRFQVR
jgi:hypothetical protein